AGAPRAGAGWQRGMVVEGPGVVVDGGAACLADPPPHAAVSAAAMSTAMSMERPGTSPSWLRAASSLTPPMSPGLLLQVLVTGLAAGAAYGLVGIGIALVYRLTGVLQLAHGRSEERRVGKEGRGAWGPG